MAPASDRPRFFEEIAVGDRFESADLTVSEEDIVAFARAFDPQPAHVDSAAAQASFFGGLAASGWHTAALTMRLVVGSRILGAEPIVGLGVEELRWLKPVRPGDRLQVRSEVIERRLSRSMPRHGLLRVRIETVKGDGAVVQSMVTTILAPRAAS